MKATIFKIDRLNTHNGPGFRTVVYLKGCPLHCTWCHNPEGISPEKEVWFNASKCIACGTCVEACPEDSLTLSEKGIKIDRNTCTGCQICTDVCPSKALEKIGEDYSIDDLMKIILQDKFLFDTSGGGVTVTGGEPGLYPDFVSELFRRCQENGIHVAVDTSGAASDSALEKIVQHADLVFLDIKLMDAYKLKEFTGLSLKQFKKTVSFLVKYSNLHQSLKIEIRTPLIPRVTDSETNLKAIANFMNESFSENVNWELCLFNDLCEDKYIKMNKTWQFNGLKHTRKDMNDFHMLQNEHPSLNISISGFLEKE